jgi:hypothetical protein
MYVKVMPLPRPVLKYAGVDANLGGKKGQDVLVQVLTVHRYGGVVALSLVQSQETTPLR